VKWESLWCRRREFSYESVGERILQIGPHLPKLLSDIKWHTFLRRNGHTVYFLCVVASFIAGKTLQMPD